MAPTIDQAREAALQAAVAAEIVRYGTLEAACAALANDACGAAWGAPVHAIYNAALAERARRKAHGRRAA